MTFSNVHWKSTLQTRDQKPRDCQKFNASPGSYPCLALDPKQLREDRDNHNILDYAVYLLLKG